MLTATLRSLIVACVVTVTFIPGSEAQAPPSPTPPAVDGGARAEAVARGFDHPWALAFLPDGRMLVTERSGRLRSVDRDGRVSDPIANVPQVAARGQGGLLDVALDPRFAENRLIYLSYAEPGEGGKAGTAVARGAARRRTPRGRPGDLPAAAQGGWREPLRVPPRLRPRRHPLRHAGRPLRLPRPGAGSVGRPRQDRADQPGRLGAARQPLRRAAPAHGPRSGRTGIATSRAPRFIRRPDSSGPWSTGRAAVTS